MDDGEESDDELDDSEDDDMELVEPVKQSANRALLAISAMFTSPPPKPLLHLPVSQAYASENWSDLKPYYAEWGLNYEDVQVLLWRNANRVKIKRSAALHEVVAQQRIRRSEARGVIIHSQSSQAVVPLSRDQTAEWSYYRAMAAYLLTSIFVNLQGMISVFIHEEGVLFVNDYAYVLNEKKDRWLRLTVQTPTDRRDINKDLVALQRSNENAFTNALQNVSARLCQIARKVMGHLHQHSYEVEEASGSPHFVYTGPLYNESRPWVFKATEQNKWKMNDCFRAPWFLNLALRSVVPDTVTFDDLDAHMIRSGKHVIQARPWRDGGFTLSLSPFEGQHLMLDAKHDLSGLPMRTPLTAATLSSLPEVREARACMEAWLAENTDFLLFGIAERLLIKVQKHSYIFEASADFGKTALLDLIKAACGTYAERMANDAIKGGEKEKTVKSIETSMMNNGVRFMLHDEVDGIDFDYLKQQSNAAPAHEMAAGKRRTATAKYKATRIITRNAGKHAHKTASANIDTRRKIVLWDDSTLRKPPYNPELFAKIKGADPTLARGFFLACIEVFVRRSGKSYCEIPTPLRCGDDLRRGEEEPADPITGPIDLSGVEHGQALIATSVRAAFNRLYRKSTDEEGGTTAKSVIAVLATQPDVPRYLGSLTVDVFATHFLGAGRDGMPDLIRRNGKVMLAGTLTRSQQVFQVLGR